MVEGCRGDDCRERRRPTLRGPFLGKALMERDSETEKKEVRQKTAHIPRFLNKNSRGTEGKLNYAAIGKSSTEDKLSLQRNYSSHSNTVPWGLSVFKFIKQ